jgi:hypothetical protein
MDMVKQLKNRVWTASVAFSLALTAFSPVAAAAEGRIMFVSGGAYIERGTQKLPIQEEMLVQVGDTLVTEDDGRVQWRMADDSYFAIRPSSRFKIEEFSEPSGGGGGKAFYSLLKGGYRSITGLIGKKDTAAYRVKSPVATMGVRGTDHTHVLCEADCSWAPGGNVADGLYTRVDSGSSVLTNPDGSLDVKAGQYARTASPPALLSTMPSVFTNWTIDFKIDIVAAAQGRCVATIKSVRSGADCTLRIESDEVPPIPGVPPSPN